MQRSLVRKCSVIRNPRFSSVRVHAIFEKFSESAIRACMTSQREANYFKSREVCCEHLFLGIVSSEAVRFNFDARQARDAVADASGTAYDTRVASFTGDIKFSKDVRDVFVKAVDDARSSRYVIPEQLLRRLVLDCEVVQKALVSLNVNIEEHLEQLEKRLTHEPEAAPKKPANKASKNMLDTYCVDLCARAADDGIDPVVGRQTEIERMIQILTRRRKNNPILVGEAGVGKTALAEGIARRIVESPETLPEELRSARIYAVNLNTMVAGTRERGEFEERLKKLMQEAIEDPDVILFIDEIHTLVTMGKSEGTLDAANILKPPLARGELRCIGATTWDEYQKYFAADGALDRRFQRVFVDEPDDATALQVLLGLRNRYERFHGVRYENDAFDAIIGVCRLIGDRQMPDKAIDLMDEAGSRVKLESGDEFGMLARALMVDRDQAVQEGRFSDARVLQERIVACAPVVTVDAVRRIGEEWSGVKWTSNSFDPAALALALQARIVSQNTAKEAVVNCLSRAYAGLRDTSRPVASFVFVGPSGVGKTEMAKSIADSAFNGSLIRFDMSEFMESHSLSKLLGAPPGYVGYDEPGELTEAIRRRPQSVVLLDEIEKAHSSMQNVLLQLLDEGRLTDAKGRTVSFRQSLIILTSNLGTQHHRGGSSSLFAPSKRRMEVDVEYVRAFFRPEVLNRIDEIIVFNSLDRDSLRLVAEKTVAEVLARTPASLSVSIQDDTLDRIVSAALQSDPGGPRAVRRCVTDIVENALADAILTHQTTVSI